MSRAWNDHTDRGGGGRQGGISKTSKRSRANQCFDFLKLSCNRRISPAAWSNYYSFTTADGDSQSSYIDPKRSISLFQNILP